MLQRKIRARGMLLSVHKREGKRAFCCDHYRKDTFSEFSEARKGKISTSIPQFLLLDWKESSTWHISEGELCAIALTWVQQHHHKAWSRWQGVGCGVSRSNQGDHWLSELQMSRDKASLVFNPPCCTNLWDTNTLEGFQPVGGVWWDNNTPRWLITALWELPFIFSYSSPLCYESSDTAEAENRLCRVWSARDREHRPCWPCGEPCRTPLLSSPLRQKHREGVSLLLLWTAHRILECGDRGMTNIQVVIQVWRWEEGPHTDPEAGKYPWIPQARIWIWN